MSETDFVNVVAFPRYGQEGYYNTADLPDRAPLSQAVMSSGWPELDRIFRFYHGQYVVVTGLAGHGKSTFLFNMLLNMAEADGTRMFMYVPENESNIKHTLQRIWNARSRKTSFDYVSSNQFFVQSARPEHYGDEPRTLPWLLDRAVVAVEKDHCEIVLIDPWNEIEWAKPRDMLLTDYINQCNRLIKDFTRHFDVAVVMVAHPTKAVNEGGGRIPTLSDIEGSMSWYTKCDNGLIVVRETDFDVARVISAKVREQPDAGRIGVQRFHVDDKTGLFTPVVGVAGEQQPQARDHRRNR